MSSTASINRFGLKLPAVALFVLFLLTSCGKGPASTTDQAYNHVVVLGDLHLPGTNIQAKEHALAAINSWQDVEMVVAVGDICADFGTQAEYDAARSFFAGLEKPLMAITGNHDYFHKSPPELEELIFPDIETEQEVKLDRFRRTFGLTSHYYSRQVGEYLLIFLSADHREFTVGMSARQLDWLRAELQAHRKTPTIIFFHAPLKGTLRDYQDFINTSGFIAQPADIMDEILADNRQVFLWVSGHTHTSAFEESFAAPINLYAGRITTIHNTRMDSGMILTNSLFLYPGKVMVRSYCHRLQRWMPRFDRAVLY